MSVQAQETAYNLESLGWKAFQDLCLTVVSDVLGQTVQDFHPSNDGGRDGAFHGSWEPENGELLTGSFTVQCKFTSKIASISLSKLKDELPKAQRLAEHGLAKNYLLMTNFSVKGTTDEVIKREFESIEGIERFVLFGKEWLTRKIRESAQLRILVPRVYGLGDLSQILDQRAYEQAGEILNVYGNDLAKFVVTEVYSRSARALVKHGFVLLLGAPASGKSTIGAGLAIGALDNWQCSTLMIRNPDEFVDHWNPNEPKQFFWVDDAFGTTQYQRDVANKWNSIFPHMKAAIKRGARVLFTSRDYIYRAACDNLKTSSFPLINESQVVIDVEALKISEKEQILYNHIKLGEQPRHFKTSIKPFLPEVAANPNFLPEIARRLGNPFFTKDLSLNHSSVEDFVETPKEFLGEIVSNLDSASRVALVLVFMTGGTLDSPLSLTNEQTNALALLGVKLADARKALNALNGSLVSFVRSGDQSSWRFKHPTIGDALASFVASDPELIDIYLAGTSVETVTQEVTCGDVGLNGVKVVVPKSRFDVFTSRLDALGKGARLWNFLASRCDESYLKHYLSVRGELLPVIVKPPPYLSASPKARLVARLHSFGLLPEDARVRFYQHVKLLVVDTPDVDFLSDEDLRSIFRQKEIEKLVEVVKEEVIPSLSDHLDAWMDDFCSDGVVDPENHLEPLWEVVQTLKIEFRSDSVIIDKLEVAEQEIADAIQYLYYNYPPADEYIQEDIYERGSDPQIEANRDVFDDVDK